MRIFLVIVVSMFFFGCTLALDIPEDSSVCGDEIGQGAEQCDGDDLRGQTCGSMNQGEGYLDCNSNCTFDYDACDGPESCGNGLIDIGESCDGNNLGEDNNCSDYGYDPQVITDCTEWCTHDLMDCI
jgi:hypothetical protein